MAHDADRAAADDGDQPLQLTIMDSEYRVACRPEQRSVLQAAAQRLDETMREIRTTGKVLGVERIAVMAALNLSHELLVLQTQTAALEGTVNTRLRKLLQHTEELLEQLS